MARGHPHRRMRLGLRARLMLLLGTLAFVALGLAVASHLLLDRLEHQLLAIYEQRVLPVRALKSVSDRYAIDIVDTVHKVCARRLSSLEGADQIQRARKSSDTSWASITQDNELVEGHIPEPTNQLRATADAAAARAQRLMEESDLYRLERFRSLDMYPAIEPLTENLEGLVHSEVKATDELVRRTQADLERVRWQAALGLLCVSLIALAVALTLSRRLMRGLEKIGTVLRAVAGGDLSQQARLGGNDELTRIGEDIDDMIAKLAGSRQQLEQHSAALARAAQQAQTANTAKSLFLSSMSHELRTPLNVVLGYAQLMARSQDRSASDQQALERVLDAGRHLLALINDVLSISKIEAGKLSVRDEPFSARDLLTSVEGLFEEKAGNKGLRLICNADSSLHPWVRGDEKKLRQVLVNLVGNAIKFTVRGEVQVRLWQDGEQLHGSVTDTGPGIPEQERDRLFQSFFQGTTGSNVVEGAGLGLYISSSLVHHMGGALSVAERSAPGAEFRFFVVAPQCELGVPQHHHRNPRLPADAIVDPALVVDDRLANRELLSQLLTEMGFVVEQVNDGQQAVEACERQSYSLVWMDLRMPVLDGTAAMRIIRGSDEAAGNAPRRIVAITASVLEIDRAAALQMGFDDLINKPFDVQDVADTIERLLNIRLVDQQPANTPTKGSTPLAERSLPVTIEGLRELSPTIRSQLLTSLVAGDVDGAIDLIDELPDLGVIASLRRVVESFQVEPVIRMLRELDTQDPVLGGASKGTANPAPMGTET